MFEPNNNFDLLSRVLEHQNALFINSIVSEYNKLNKLNKTECHFFVPKVYDIIFISLLELVLLLDMEQVH